MPGNVGPGKVKQTNRSSVKSSIPDVNGKATATSVTRKQGSRQSKSAPVASSGNRTLASTKMKPSSFATSQEGIGHGKSIARQNAAERKLAAPKKHKNATEGGVEEIRSSTSSLDFAVFEELLRDTSARIIQAYWKSYRSRQVRTRSDDHLLRVNNLAECTQKGDLPSGELEEVQGYENLKENQEPNTNEDDPNFDEPREQLQSVFEAVPEIESWNNLNHDKNATDLHTQHGNGLAEGIPLSPSQNCKEEDTSSNHQMASNVVETHSPRFTEPPITSSPQITADHLNQYQQSEWLEEAHDTVVQCIDENICEPFATTVSDTTATDHALPVPRLLESHTSSVRQDAVLDQRLGDVWNSDTSKNGVSNVGVECSYSEHQEYRTSEKVQSIMELLQNAKSQEGISPFWAESTNDQKKYHELPFGRPPPHTNVEEDTASVSGSLGGVSGTSVGTRSAQLAEAVYDGFRHKISKLRSDLEQRDASIVALNRELERVESLHRAHVDEIKNSKEEALDGQKSAYESDLTQRLQFIEALLADKDKLAKDCEKLSCDIKLQQEKHRNEIESLKAGWMLEMKKQKEGWHSAEKTRREQWADQKKKEITEMAAKVMEPKIMEMADTYNREVKRLKDKLESHERMLEEHERHSMQTRDRLLKDREDALEKERMSAHARVMQEREKHKIELEAEQNRARAEIERRKNAHEAAVQQQQQTFTDRIQRLEKTHQEEVRKVNEEAERRKVEQDREHSKGLTRVREDCGAEREGWKEAVRERAERQMRQEVEKIRGQLEEERDAEIQEVLNRLEGKTRSLRDEIAKRDATFASERQAASQAIEKCKMDMECRVRHGEKEREAAECRAKRSEDLLANAQAELDRRNETIRWLEEQISKGREENLQRAQDLTARFESKQNACFQELQVAEGEKSKLLKQNRDAQKRIETLKNAHRAELSTVEVRVKETLNAKDAQIRALQQDVSRKQLEIESLNGMLLRHREELAS